MLRRVFYGMNDDMIVTLHKSRSADSGRPPAGSCRTAVYSCAHPLRHPQGEERHARAKGECGDDVGVEGHG